MAVKNSGGIKGSESPKLLWAKEVAQLFNVNSGTIAKWRRKGKLRYVTLPSGRVQYPADQFNEFRELLEKGGVSD